MPKTFIRSAACAVLVGLWGCASAVQPVGDTTPEPQTEIEVEAIETEPTEVAEAPAEPAPAEEPGPLTLADVGFATPESVRYYAEADIYLVSNINGPPTEADDNGFISRVSPEGKLLELKWINGEAEEVTLNAPKGMTIAEDILYVADLDTVRMFDCKTGDPKGEIKIKGATFLNGMATGPDGTIYVSDSGLKAGEKGLEPTGTDAIYRLVRNRRARPVIKSKELGQPNGLIADEDGLLVASFGSGELYRVKLKGKGRGKRSDVQQVEKGVLDGLVRTTSGQLLVSSWGGSSIYRRVAAVAGEQPAEAPAPDEGGAEQKEATPPRPLFEPIVSEVKSPADIGYDGKRNRLLVPLFEGNAIQIHELGAPAPEQTPAAETPPAEEKPAAPAPKEEAAAPAAQKKPAAPAAQKKPAVAAPQGEDKPIAPPAPKKAPAAAPPAAPAAAPPAAEQKPATEKAPAAEATP